jgi:PII-like signaling protein
MLQKREREAKLFALAKRLDFIVEKIGDRFKLTRTLEVSSPVIEDGLTIKEAEDVLNTWKLRGLQGG